MMRQRKGKKSLIYFFLLIIVGSVNNLSLSNIKFDKIKNINVSGLDINENSIIFKEIEDLDLKNIFFVNGDKIKKTLDSNTLVENYEVYKKYPFSLNIKIIKTNFLARIKNDEKIFLIGSNGKLSENNLSDKKLPFIFGKPEIKEFLYFKEILEQSKFEYEQIEKFYFFPSKRWDVEFKNNILLKLPKNNVKNSLDNAYKFIQDPKFGNMKIIDARIQNQIILND